MKTQMNCLNEPENEFNHLPVLHTRKNCMCEKNCKHLFYTALSVILPAHHWSLDTFLPHGLETLFQKGWAVVSWEGKKHEIVV